jgi:hypothetical protein
MAGAVFGVVVKRRARRANDETTAAPAQPTVVSSS